MPLWVRVLDNSHMRTMSHIYEATWLHVEMVPFTCLVEFVTCRWLIGHVCFALDGRQRGDSSRSWYLHDPIWMSRIQWQGCRFQGASIWATAQLIWMMLPLRGMTLLIAVFYKWYSVDSSINGRGFYRRRLADWDDLRWRTQQVVRDESCYLFDQVKAHIW